MRIERLDHLVLTVRDVQATADFYARVLGMRVETFADDAGASVSRCVSATRRSTCTRPATSFEPKALSSHAGAAATSVLHHLASPEEIAAHLHACGVAILAGAGPAHRRPRANRPPVDFRDPEQNLIESPTTTNR